MTLSLFRPRIRELTAAVLLSTRLTPLPLPVLVQAVVSSPSASVNPRLDSATATNQVQSNLSCSMQVGRQSPYLPKESTVIDAPTYELPGMGNPSTTSLSLEMERCLGDCVMRQIRRDPDLVPDPLITDYLSTVDYKLIEAAHRQHVAGSTSAPSFELLAVRDPDISASVLPGGYIGVSTDTLVVIENESGLTSVLGYKINHVLQRHIAHGTGKSGKSMQIALVSIPLVDLTVMKSRGAAQALAMGGQVAAVSSQLAFSHGVEREADRVDFTLLTGVGYNLDDIPDLFRRLQRVTNIAGTGVIPGYTRTHPLTGERIADVEDHTRGLPHLRQPCRPEFGSAKVCACMLQETPTSGYIDARNAIRSQLSLASDMPVEKHAALWYDIVATSQMVGRLDEAEQALQEARRLYGNILGIMSSSVELDVTAVELARARNRAPEALTLAYATLAAYPLSRAVDITYA